MKYAMNQISYIRTYNRTNQRTSTILITHKHYPDHPTPPLRKEMITHYALLCDAVFQFAFTNIILFVDSFMTERTAFNCMALSVGQNGEMSLSKRTCEDKLPFLCEKGKIFIFSRDGRLYKNVVTRGRGQQ